MKKDDVAIVPAKWVKGWMLMSLFGLTPEAARKKRERGEWQFGRHYLQAPDGNYMYNWREIEKWYEGIL